MNEGIVLITGGSRGIGAATATLLAEQGKKVVIVDIQPEPIAGGAILWPAPFDVASEGGVVAGVADIEKAHGPVSGLVNAAGIFGKMHTLEKVRMEQWDREVNIDLRGTFTQRFPLGKRLRSLVAFSTDEPQRSVVPLGSRAIANELSSQRGVIHRASPARISARCITRSGLR